ncbi:MAG: S-methyl-5-thioribose-1-phosphate isomerase [Candidatus Accumulibacter sp.]|jgi:methylthioribose-1-phosphate isomerase|nr:S-methyl-5-thioribose-1-phosphate isomerase [Accumulibacter sp.]
MKIGTLPTRTLWPDPDGRSIHVIDQTALPNDFRVLRISRLEEAVSAIRAMQVRGAPLIGVTAAYGLALAIREKNDDGALEKAIARLKAARPTAVNLHWALARMRTCLLDVENRAEAAWIEAGRIAEEDVDQCRKIGEHGLDLLKSLAEKKSGKLEIMTHCNAGRLAAIDRGTAISPIYAGIDAGIDIHVWVSETRPRNQGLLTAWELRQRGIPHTVFSDNAAGYLLAQDKIDAVIVGADRIATNGDVANKIGTRLKAIAAHFSKVPFFVAAPRSTFDFSCADGTEIPIEERSGEEVRTLSGLDADGTVKTFRLLPEGAPVFNPAFDVTPAQFITAFITERGVCIPGNLSTLFGEKKKDA